MALEDDVNKKLQQLAGALQQMTLGQKKTVWLITYHNPDEGDILYDNVVYASKEAAQRAIAELCEELERTRKFFSMHQATVED
jgi:hypothetical protein